MEEIGKMTNEELLVVYGGYAPKTEDDSLDLEQKDIIQGLKDFLKWW